MEQVLVGSTGDGQVGVFWRVEDGLDAGEGGFVTGSCHYVRSSLALLNHGTGSWKEENGGGVDIAGQCSDE